MGLGQVGDEGAAGISALRHEVAVGHQDADALAQGDPADAEQGGEVSLVGQPVSGAELAAVDLGAQRRGERDRHRAAEGVVPGELIRWRGLRGHVATMARARHGHT
jgi:hypothetical protein